MTIDEVVLLLKASLANALTPLQEMVLRSSWEGKTYTSIAMEAHYGEERVRKVASNLWQLLSNFWKEPINKSNFRTSLEPLRLTKAQQQLIKEFNSTATAISLEFPNAPVSLNSKFYISRPPIEELVYAEIAEPGSFICIQAPKKMGKSSLVIRILSQAAFLNYSTVSLDFQQADKAVFVNIDKFLRWFCANVSRELGVEPKLNDYWNEEMGSKISCSVYFQDYLLSGRQSPIVIALNELDWIFEYPEIASEFLPLLRSWYEQAKRVEIWQKLRLVLAYSTSMMIPLRLSQSPLNIGLPIKLPLFTKQQVEDLAQRHGLDWSGADAEKLMGMVGGHPYLVRLALYYLVGKGGLSRDLGKLLQQAPTKAGIYHEYLMPYVLTLQAEPELESAFYEVVSATSPVKLEPVLAYKLQSMGLVNFVSDTPAESLRDRAYPACELYRLYFREQLNTKPQPLNMRRMEKLEPENQQLRIVSNLDPLTQLANSSYFNTYLQLQWQEAVLNRTSISLVMCDVDYFKIDNKTYANTTADECLRQIADIVRNSVKHFYDSSFTDASTVRSARENSRYATHVDDTKVLAARYRGEKFAIISQLDAAATLQLAENIREQVKALAIKCDYPGIDSLPAHVLTVSLGVTCMIPEPEQEPACLLAAAEQALEQAKRKGGDRVVLL